MSPQSPKELLEHLRATLKHFDECPLGNYSDVADIRRRLLQRIADVERIVQLTEMTANRTAIRDSFFSLGRIPASSSWRR